MDPVMTGLVISDARVEVPGHAVVTCHDDPRYKLDPGDYRARKTTWVRQVMLHTLRGIWPQPVLPGAGAGGEALRIADIWRTDPVHSAAHIIVESDGSIVQLASDLATVCSYHAEASNEWSVGIEMAQDKDGAVHQATLDATVACTRAICDAMGIPFQVHSAPYLGDPLLRMEVTDGSHRQQIGGPDLVGILGHRNNTSQRGRGDPGDAIYGALIASGAEPIDYSTGDDLRIGKARQAWLNAECSRRGLTWSPLVVDGLVGPRSLARAKLLGLRWRDVPA